MIKVDAVPAEDTQLLTPPAIFCKTLELQAHPYCHMKSLLTSLTTAVPVFLLILFMSLWAHVVSASVESAGDSLSFGDAYRLARDSNPQLAIAGYKVDGKRAERDVARGTFFPQVSIFGDWSENKVRYEGSALAQLPSQDYPGERYGLQLRSPLLNMKAYREYERQGALVDQSERELEVAESQLLSLVVEVYLNLLLAKENLIQVESELAALERELEEAKALFDRSLLPITRVLETQTRLDILGADIINARGSVVLSEQRLAQLVGLDNAEPMQIEERIVLMSTVSNADQAVILALQFDAATAAAREGVSAAKKAVEREKGSWWPNIDFIYTSQYSDVGFDNLTSPPRSSESYSVSIRYPLFEGGAGSARLRAAWASYYSAQQNLEATTRETEGRARTAWVNLEVATKREQATRQSVATADINVDATRKAVRVGTANVADVLMALAQRTRARRDLTEARFQRAMSWVELMLVTGEDPIALASRLSAALHGQ